VGGAWTQVAVTKVESAFRRTSGSSHYLRNQDAVNVGEPHVTAVEAIGQLLVVDAEQVENRRVQVVRRNRLLLRLVAELVTGADCLAALDAGARHPHGHRP